VVVEEITERKRIEAALRDSEERFRALADSIPQLAFMADATGSVFWYNQRWFDYTGLTRAEASGSGWRKAHHPDHLARVLERIQHSLATGQAWEDTFPLRDRSGSYRWFLSRAVPIRDEHGRIHVWFGTNTDVTEQRLAEETLREADRLKNDFLAFVAHELRAPLAPILTAAKIVGLRASTDPGLQNACAIIVRQATQLSRLVEDLLDIGRITAGKLRLTRKPVELQTIITQAVETCAPLFAERRQTLDVSVQPGPILVDVDDARIVQVICNLLNNASKYMREGGQVQLTASQEDGAAVVRVRDDGVGIPPAMLGSIFDLFVQIDSSRHRAEGGLGIGLAVVKSLVEMHGGSVAARSDGAGRGAEFTVRLPLADPPRHCSS
jgi:PAS domain S-box-containing protein